MAYVPADPFADVLRELRAASSASALRKVLHPPNLTAGFATEADTYATTMRWLKELLIYQPQLSTMEVAATSNEFSIRYLVPVPHRQAVCALCSRNGWPKEGLLQGLFGQHGLVGAS